VGPRHVLVIDDNVEICLLIAAILKKAGFAVDEAHDVLDGMARVRARRYSAILLDLRMPGLNGMDAIDHLKLTDPDSLSRVVIVTGFANDAEFVGNLRDQKFFALLSKPFDVDHLVRAVTDCATHQGEVEEIGIYRTSTDLRGGAPR